MPEIICSPVAMAVLFNFGVPNPVVGESEFEFFSYFSIIDRSPIILIYRVSRFGMAPYKRLEPDCCFYLKIDP